VFFGKIPMGIFLLRRNPVRYKDIRGTCDIDDCRHHRLAASDDLKRWHDLDSARDGDCREWDA
jgi:hypothetical protein